MKRLAIVGRPNVGKSALFNRIVKKRIAIVHEEEGITRDRIYAEADLFGKPFEVIDTGGIDPRSPDEFGAEIRRQAKIAIEEADTIVMVVDARVGPTLLDCELASLLLRTDKPITLAINKIDNENQESFVHQFHKLGIEKMIGTSAAQGHNIAELLEQAWEGACLEGKEVQEAPIRICVLGRANVGKSTLLNTLLEEKRCVVSPIAGTTRDSIDIPFRLEDQDYVLMDTAGIRRKHAEHEVVDKFAYMRTKEALERSDVCLFLVDAREPLTMQEKRIATQIEESGKGCIVLCNKWDLVKGYRMEHCLKQLKQDAPFLTHCPFLFISALSGRNVDKIFTEVSRVYEERKKRVSTHQLNTFLERAMQRNVPPRVQGKRLRVYYLTQTSVAPPRFTLFINNPQLMTKSYQKYLINQLREKYGFLGSPLQFKLRGKKKDPRAKTLGS